MAGGVAVPDRTVQQVLSDHAGELTTATAIMTALSVMLEPELEETELMGPMSVAAAMLLTILSQGLGVPKDEAGRAASARGVELGIIAPRL